MNINRYAKRKSRLSNWALIFPSIAVAVAIIEAAYMFYAAKVDNFLLFISSMMTMFASLSIVFPVCGIAGLVFAILALRKQIRQKRIIGAIVWNGILLLLGILILCYYTILL